MARKPKSPELRKTRTVNVSMTESQYQTLFEEAKNQGISVGKYVRGLIDSRRVVISHEIVLDASQVLPVLRELSRIGNNLNQVAHLCNTIKRVDDDLELRLRKLNINLLAIIGACGPGGMTKKIIWTSASNQTGSVGNQRRAYPRVHLPDNHILRINGSTSYQKPGPSPPTLSTEAFLATDASVTLMIGAKTIKVRIPKGCVSLSKILMAL